MGADSGGSNTGLQMGRNRAHSKDLYTNIGEDNQTHPLQDIGALLAGRYNQGNALSNYAAGGTGWAGAFSKPSAYPPPPSPAGGGGAGAGPRATGQGADMNNARMANPGAGASPYNPPIQGIPAHSAAAPDPGYAWGNQGYGNTTVDNGGMYDGDVGGTGVDTPVYGDPSDPANGVPNPINKGQHFNYLPNVDPNDGYFPRYTDILNDEDNARPSPIKPQGASNDPFSAPLGDSVSAPTGGLMGGLMDFASGQRTPYEEQVGSGLMDIYRNPRSFEDAAATEGFNFGATGGMTGLEGETRGYQQRLADGLLSDNANEGRGFYRGFATGGPTDTESQNRELMLAALKDFGPGGAYDGGSSYTMNAGGGGLGPAYDSALGGYQDVLANPGYSDAEKAAIIGEGMRTARTGFDVARAQMENRQATTGNGAGFYEALGGLATAQSNALGQQARRNQIDIANEAARRREDALHGLSGLANTEEAANATASASANAAASRAAQMQQAQMQARLAALGQLSGWDEDQRRNKLAGMSGVKDYDMMQNDNMKFGVSGMQAGDMDRSKRMQASNEALAAQGQNMFGRKMGALQGANTWAQQGRDNQKFGVTGLAGFYGAQQQQNADDIDRLIRVYSTPREKYNENFYTKGQGGIGGNSNFAGSGG